MEPSNPRVAEEYERYLAAVLDERRSRNLERTRQLEERGNCAHPSLFLNMNRYPEDAVDRKPRCHSLDLLDELEDRFMAERLRRLRPSAPKPSAPTPKRRIEHVEPNRNMYIRQDDPRGPYMSDPRMTGAHPWTLSRIEKRNPSTAAHPKPRSPSPKRHDDSDELNRPPTPKAQPTDPAPNHRPEPVKKTITNPVDEKPTPTRKSDPGCTSEHIEDKDLPQVPREELAVEPADELWDVPLGKAPADPNDDAGWERAETRYPDSDWEEEAESDSSDSDSDCSSSDEDSDDEWFAVDEYVTDAVDVGAEWARLTQQEEARGRTLCRD